MALEEVVAGAVAVEEVSRRRIQTNDTDRSGIGHGIQACIAVQDHIGR